MQNDTNIGKEYGKWLTIIVVFLEYCICSLVTWGCRLARPLLLPSFLGKKQFPPQETYHHGLSRQRSQKFQGPCTGRLLQNVHLKVSRVIQNSASAKPKALTKTCENNRQHCSLHWQQQTYLCVTSTTESASWVNLEDAATNMEHHLILAPM